MRRFLCCSAVVALAFASPAMAKPKPDKPDKPAKPTKPSKPYACIPKSVGYSASGTLVTDGLTQSAGQDTATKRDDRYSGAITVFVKKANHKSVKDEQTFTVTDARVRVHPHAATAPKAGDRVKLKGKTTKVTKKCVASTAVTTIKRIDIKTAKAA
ncbi:MAG: hypothetical protein QOF76_3074 [Solirubrobacteraceae bacterium]|nr:hypothetical protein [Solirubrobacteraceae bacterium]